MITGILVGWLLYWIFGKTKTVVKAQRMRALSASFPPGPDGFYPIKINRIKDGDTFNASFVKLPWHTGLVDVDVRCFGYDAYEISKKRKSVTITNTEIAKGQKAKIAFEELIAKARWAYLRPEVPEIDCYGRILGSLYLQIPGEDELVSVSEWMSSHGHTRK